MEIWRDAAITCMGLGILIAIFRIGMVIQIRSTYNIPVTISSRIECLLVISFFILAAIFCALMDIGSQLRKGGKG